MSEETKKPAGVAPGRPEDISDEQRDLRSNRPKRKQDFRLFVEAWGQPDRAGPVRSTIAGHACTLRETVFIHVMDDGVEIRFPERPDDLLHLTVEVWVADDGKVIEQTHTRNVKIWSGARLNIFITKPRGEGWEVLDAKSDGYALWWRVAK